MIFYSSYSKNFIKGSLCYIDFVKGVFLKSKHTFFVVS